MLQELYKNDISKKLIQLSGYKNVMQVPRVLKISLNTGFSKGTTASTIDAIVKDFTLIVGQKPIFTYAQKSIAGFSIRKGDCLGCKVTLRKRIMYLFLDRLLYLALPKERDFRGFKVSQFDGNGNFSFGIKEHIIFPEVNYENIPNSFGMDVTLATSAVTNNDAQMLLSQLGFPFI